MKKLGIIVQARMGSTRLPGKVLLPFQGTTILGYIIEKLKKLDIGLVVATSQSTAENDLIKYLIENDVFYFRGTENNVLQRFINTAERFSFTHIIRVCADSPFIDMELVAMLLDNFKECQGVDYLSFSYNGLPTVLSHFGVFVEFVSLNALKKIKEGFPNNVYYQEHVTAGVYSNPHKFNVKLYPIDDKFKIYEGLRLTVDTMEDYNHILKIANNYLDKKDGSDGFLDIAPKIMKDKMIVKEMKLIINNNNKLNE